MAEPKEKRYGRQTPTKSFVLPYEESLGSEAIEAYNKSGNTAQPWQELMINDIMAVNDEGLYTHSKFGYSVPRRNGKGEILVIRELIGMLKGEHILHTAHRTATSSSASRRLAKCLENLGYKEVMRPKVGETYPGCYSYSKQFGLEKIKLFDTDAVCEFRTRTSSGGLGEGFDLWVADEAQELTVDQENTLKYTVSDSMNPQIIMCGTPPTAVSVGTVFVNLRDAVFTGKTEDTGWAEWSVSVESDPHDVDLWYETSPAMGYQLNERKVKQEIGDDIVDFNIQRLGLWYQSNQKSAISAEEWEACKIAEKPQKPKSKPIIGIKYGKNNENVCMAVAVRLSDGSIFSEVLDCRPIMYGNQWILQNIAKIGSDIVVIDGQNRSAVLKDEMKEYGLRPPIIPTTAEIIKANALFEQAIQTQTIKHSGQPSVTQAVTNCGKRNIGSNGGFGYESIVKGVEVALLDSMMLAHWKCHETKHERKQKVSY